MATHVMLDFETLDTAVTATILSVGIVKFDPNGTGILDEYYAKVDIDEQTAYNRTISDSTLAWWSKQDPAIMDEAFSLEGRKPFLQVIDEMHKFMWGADYFWSHGATFDLMIVQDIYDDLGKAYPWNYYNMRDTRTLFSLCDVTMDKTNLHNPLEDAKRQAKAVQEALTILNVQVK